MNRQLSHTCMILLVIGILSSCIEEKNLRPFLLPELVNTPNYLVESFTEDSALIVASEGGVYIRYGNQTQYAFPAADWPVFGELDVTNLEVLYTATTRSFWVISDSTILRLSDNELQAYTDTTSFYQPTRFYYDYVLSPNGTLHRIDYYDEVWDPNSGSFFSDYFISIHRFTGNRNDLWNTTETDLIVNSSFLSTPHTVFTEGGDMLILTNPSYRIAETDLSASDPTIIEREDGFNTIADPYLGPSGRIYGFLDAPTNFNPANTLISATTEGTELTLVDLLTPCANTNDIIGPVKVLEWGSDRVWLYVQFFTNQLTPGNENLGFIHTNTFDGSACDVIPLRSDPILLPFSNDIRDVALLNGKLYLGTESGLLVYDLETEAIEPYLKDLFEDRTQ